MEERDEEDDALIEVGGVPFIADTSFLERYGRAFSVTLNENQQPVLSIVAD
ncbi:MAG: hypothetical protein V3573_06610 [Desulfovibrionaceae bacterium]